MRFYGSLPPGGVDTGKCSLYFFPMEPLNILYEDEALLAVDKPSGLLTSPDRWDKKIPCLIRQIHAERSPDIFNVHRLDRDTSGVLLCAKTKPALDLLCRAFEQRTIRKQYVALTHHIPPRPQMTISLKLADDPDHPARTRVSSAGKPAFTEISQLEVFKDYAYIQAEPRTGRQHQIRVHLAGIHCPILHDTFYGDGHQLYLSAIKRHYKAGRGEEQPLIRRLALHALQLTLDHPTTGKPLVITAPLPHDFEVALKYLRRFASLQPATDSLPTHEA